MAPGIYFGLEEAAYHADPSLGSHSIIQLRSGGPSYWWESWMNPLKAERGEAEAAHLVYGHAVHKLVLEGRAAFEAAFARMPVIEDFPGCCRTVDDIKARLTALQLPTSGTKAVITERLKAADPSATFWDDILAEHAASGKTLLKPEQHQELLLSTSMISKNPHLQPSFRDGYPEVSIFWVDDGIPCKARIDYLKLKATVDLKSILTTRDTRSFERLVINHIASYRYDIQFAHYRQAREAARAFVAEDKVFDLTAGAMLETEDVETGEITERPAMPSKKWLNAFAKTADYTWVWVFLGKNGPPLAKGFEFMADDPAAELAADDRRIALETYRQFMTRFGTDMWLVMDPVQTLTGSDLPGWMGAAA